MGHGHLDPDDQAEVGPCNLLVFILSFLIRRQRSFGGFILVTRYLFLYPLLTLIVIIYSLYDEIHWSTATCPSCSDTETWTRFERALIVPVEI